MIRRKIHVGALWGAVAGALIILAGACDDGDPAELVRGGTDAGDVDSRAFSDGHFSMDDAQDAAEDRGPDFTCTADLHHVVDRDGKVVMTCPDTQGCEYGTGKCVSPCDSSMSNQSGYGCDYYSVQPDGSRINGICYAVIIENTWTTPVTISAEMDGTPFAMADFARIPSGNGRSMTYEPLKDNQLQPNQVAVLFISGFLCPDGVFPPNGSANTMGTMIGKAFHISTDRPVVAHDIFPYITGGFGYTSSTLLLPTSAWDVNYMSIDQYEPSTLQVGENADPEAMQLVAQEDGTTITVLPSADVAGAPDAGVVAAPKNVPTTYTIDKGEILALTNFTGLSGSVVKASKPIGMWSSVGCFNIPVGAYACDSGHQQIPPIRALGSEYVAVRYPNRRGKEEKPPWRFMGLVDGTTLTYDPVKPEGAPSSLHAGEIVKFNAAGPFVVRSQDDGHPFYMSAHMTGCSVAEGLPDGTGCELGQEGEAAEGDPESTNVVPAKQFLSSYVFFTDPSYPETSLVVVRSSVDGKFKDVTLDCGGTLGGWMPIDSAGMYEYTRFSLVSGNFVAQNGCDNGPHTMRSDNPFGVTIWGWTGLQYTGSSSSYAYAAGVSLKALNKVVVNPVPR